jgi:hypothetical protein
VVVLSLGNLTNLFMARIPHPAWLSRTGDVAIGSSPSMARRSRWKIRRRIERLSRNSRSKNPAVDPNTVERELRMHLLMHNLTRRLMLESSRLAGVPLSRISFAGALAVARRYGEALLQARSRQKRAELMDELYRVLAADLVPDRPGRREPRAVKRRPELILV